MNKNEIIKLVSKAVHNKIELDKTAYTKSEVDRMIKDDRLRIKFNIAKLLRDKKSTN